LFSSYIKIAELAVIQDFRGSDIVSEQASPCPQLPGTIARFFIPHGAVINLLNLIEISSPGGICLIVRLPFLGGAWAPFNQLLRSLTRWWYRRIY
jgi:hypothetical protein